MYQYNQQNRDFIQQRVAQFRDQVARRLSGELDEAAFKPLRLMNGLYLQLHAYMLRVAIPYGVFSAQQFRKLADIAERFDKGYGHFTTRQNIQFNWIKLSEAPDILAALAEVDMHAIQTSGNCIRNVTADPLAGVAADEIADVRVYAEIIRQWSTLHPEFSFLPRKFKFALNGASEDRAVLRAHDIGLQLRRGEDGEIGFEVLVGGGQGRTPVLAKVLNPFLAERDLLSYVEAILRVYNLHGRRDNIYKARIKILVNALGIDEFRRQVEDEWQQIRDGALILPSEAVAAIKAHFAPPAYRKDWDGGSALADYRAADTNFDHWYRRNIVAHRAPGYAIVNISLKPAGGIPGDLAAEQMRQLADLAEQYSFGEIRATYRQNLVLADVREADLPALWEQLVVFGLAASNVERITDIIACPGLDYCNLANARSIPLAQELSRRLAAFDAPSKDKGADLGPLSLHISGCINACAHHHTANIGILGVDKKGQEAYQITLGGSAGEDAAIGKILGRALDWEETTEAIERIIEIFQAQRIADESFIACYRRVGAKPFKEALHGTN